MCGIIGYFKPSGIQAADYERFFRALEDIRHRGPDGEGLVLVNSRSGEFRRLRTADTPADVPCDLSLSELGDFQADLVLGHRRLSIFDLSSRGHQPMQSPQGDFIIFNGEVYNFPELREELKVKGYAFETGTDTEVILAAYREWGPDCVRRFNGMWSIALYDQQQRSLWLSNDRAGIKQLYYRHSGEEMAFASELRPVASLTQGKLEPHAENIRIYLEHGIVDADPSTFWRDIFRFQPGHNATLSLADGRLSPLRPYWSVSDIPDQKWNLEEASARLRHLFMDAVRIRMRSDVAWGTTLSGGLDSSTIVYVARLLKNQAGDDSPIRTFTAKFPGMEGDESRFVEFIEQDQGLQADYVNPLIGFDMEKFRQFMHDLDSPVETLATYAQWQVMKMAKAGGVTVLLDGQGGDELFGGYHHHAYKYGRSLLLKGKLGALKRLARDYAQLKNIEPAEFMHHVRNDAKLWLRLKVAPPRDWPELKVRWSQASSLRKTLELDLQATSLPRLLRFEDRASMAYGLEARLPFLDYRIIEFALGLPDEFRIREGWQKYLIRHAFPEMPDSIRWRKDKKGFSIPQKDWVTQNRSEFEALGARCLDYGWDLAPDLLQLDQLDVYRLYRMAGMGLWLGKK